MVEPQGEVLIEGRNRRPVADIRVRGLLEAAARAELGRFSALLEALPAAIYTTDPAGRITSYNQAAVELWGCRPELGKSEWCGSWRLYWPDGRRVEGTTTPPGRGGIGRAARRHPRSVPRLSFALDRRIGGTARCGEHAGRHHRARACGARW